MKPGIYSFEQLKGKIEVGDRVSQVEGKSNPCASCKVGKVNTITGVRDDQFDIDGCYHSYTENGWLEVVSSQSAEDYNEGINIKGVLTLAALGLLGKAIWDRNNK